MFNKLINFTENHLVFVLAGVFILRVGYLFVNGLDLIGDESYYWDWSRIPDWCYYSKPPMVAWLIAVFTGLGGDYPEIVRLPTVVLGTVFLAYFYAATKGFYSSKAAALAVLLILATPFNVLANLIMTIDPPLYCFWMMSLYYLRGALFEQRQMDWFWAGLATGAALLSKQVALLIPLMLLVFLGLNPQRRSLFKFEFVIYLLPVIACLIPILLWNQQHDWVMYGHSKGHFGINETVGFLTRMEQAGTFFLYQLLLVSPLLFVLILNMTFKTGFLLTHLRPEEQFLFLMGPALLIGISLLSLVQKVQGNWSMPFYFSALILLSGQWLAGAWQKSLKTALWLGFLMVSLTYLLPPLAQAIHGQNAQIDPIKRFKYWSELVEKIALEREKLPHPEQTFILVVGHRFLASQLAFYLPDRPSVYRYEDTGRISSQYEVWPGPKGAVGKTAFIVAEPKKANVPDALRSSFASFRQIGSIVNARESKPYQLFLGEKLKFWPPAIPHNAIKE